MYDNSNTSKETGIIYDEKLFTRHKSPWDDGHPERPERITSILRRCKELGLLERCKRFTPCSISEDDVLRLHTSKQFQDLKDVCAEGNGQDSEKLKDLASNFDSVYIHPSTYDQALLAAGSAVHLTMNVLEGNVKNGMAIIRPPGHHAMSSEFCGYCFINNVAVVANQALRSGLANKILIVDFDVHHGQGTQQMFYNDPRVLYFSTHRYENGKFWPNLKESNYNWIGKGDGLGFNCNVPLNATHMGNTEFLTIWHKILLPLAYQFNPDLVLISAGYDSALNDPKGMMRLEPGCYPHLISPLMGLANGKVVVVLEGGYCLKALSESAALTLRTLLGDPCPMIQPICKPMPELIDTVLNVLVIQSKYWSMLKYGNKWGDSKGVDDWHIVQPLIYDWTEVPKPLKYPITNPNPVQSFENSSPFDAELDALIENTLLAVPSKRVGMIRGGKFDEATDWIKRCNLIPSGNNRNSDMIQLLRGIHDCSIQSGIFVGNKTSSIKSLDEIPRLVNDIWKEQPVMLLGFNISSNIQYSNQLLISLDDTLIKEPHERFRIQIPTPRENPKNDRLDLNAKYFTIFTNIILPAAYEFTPQLVVIVVSGQMLESSVIALLIHLVSSLANGRILIVLEDVENEDMIESCTTTLLGDPLKPLDFDGIKGCTADERLIQILKMHSEDFEVFKPFCKALPLTCSVKLGE